MFPPALGNGSLVDGPPSPSPTRSRKRKRSGIEEDYNTPTKTRSRAVNLGLPTPTETGNRMLLAASAHNVDVLTSGVAPDADSASRSAASDLRDVSVRIQAQQMTPPSSVSPTTLPTLPGIPESSPSRTRSSALSSKLNIPFTNLMLSMPYFLVQPPSTALHAASLEASVLALRRVLTLHTSNPTSQVLSLEQECYAWTMFAELGLQIINSLTPAPAVLSVEGVLGPSFAARPHTLKNLQIPSWAPNPGEIETAVSRGLRLADQVAPLRPLRHNLTILHAQLVCFQENYKHAKVLLKRLLPLSTSTQLLPREKVWASYEAHLAITNQILTIPSTSSETIDIQAAISQLNALFMLANQYGDHALVQLISVIRFTALFQNYESSDSVSTEDMNGALKEAESILGLEGFDKARVSAANSVINEALPDSTKVSNVTPAGYALDNHDALVTPFTADLLSQGGSKLMENIKTPAFSFPTNPLGMNIYGAGDQGPATVSESTSQNPQEDGLIPPYLRYLRVQILILGILWLTHSGESSRSSERLTLLHEMMDKLDGLFGTEGWVSDNESGVISIPLFSNPEHPLRILSTHPRVLYQLTFMVSAISKRDCVGRKPKRKMFAQEGLRISSSDDPRPSEEPKPDLLEGGSAFDFAPGLCLRDLRHAQQSIVDIRATVYYELIAACLIRSELEEAEQYLTDLVSFVRTSTETQPSQPSMWDRYASRITLLYGHLAHALGQSRRALQCYQTVCFLEKEESLLWNMGKVGEIVLRIGAAAVSAEGREKVEHVETMEDQVHDLQIWSPEEREILVEMASDPVDRCLNGGLGEHMAAVGRIIAATLSDEIVRTKQNLKTGLDLSSKGRDSYLRLLVLIFTAGQYLYTHTDYVLTILETCRQLASSLGAVTAPTSRDAVSEASRRSTRSSNIDERPQYHVGHARTGLWIGQRFAEIYKRRGASDKAAKQNAVNTVFQKAIESVDLLASKTGGPDPINFLDDLAPVFFEPVADPHSSKAAVRSGFRERTSKMDQSDEGLEFSQQSRETTASYPPSSPAPVSKHRSKRSDTSHSRSTVSGHSQKHSIASTSSRRSTRSRGERKVIIESDDEDAGRKAMSEDDFQGSELEESDGEVHM